MTWYGKSLNIQWRRLLPDAKGKETVFRGSPSVSSFHLPSVRNLLTNHALRGLPRHLTGLPELELCHWSSWLAPSSYFSQGPRAPDAAGSTVGARVLLGSGGSTYCVCVCVCVCVCERERDAPPANSGRREGAKEVRDYLGMAGKVIRLPEFRSVGMPNAPKS